MDKLLEALNKSGLLLSNGKPDYAKIASITGHTEASVKSLLAPGKECPRWLRLAIYMVDNTQLQVVNKIVQLPNPKRGDYPISLLVSQIKQEWEK